MWKDEAPEIPESSEPRLFSHKLQIGPPRDTVPSGGIHDDLSPTPAFRETQFASPDCKLILLVTNEGAPLLLISILILVLIHSESASLSLFCQALVCEVHMAATNRVFRAKCSLRRFDWLKLQDDWQPGNPPSG